MHSIRLNINEKVYDRLMWLLSKFGKDEVEIIQEDAEYAKTQRYLESELKDIIDGKATFIEIDELERRLKSTIKKRADSLQR